MVRYQVENGHKHKFSQSLNLERRAIEIDKHLRNVKPDGSRLRGPPTRICQQYFIKCLFGVKIAEKWHVLNSYDLYYDLSISVAYDRYVMSILLNKAYSG